MCMMERASDRAIEREMYDDDDTEDNLVNFLKEK